MIRCVAIDDEPKAIEVIERYCRKIDTLKMLAVFRQPLLAMDFIAREKPDLIFLDINMPDLNGMQLLASLSEKPKVIFTTAYSDYAVESYNLNAVDYLLKPIAFERFLTAINKVSALTSLKQVPQPQPDFVLIKSGAQTHKVKLDEILFLEKEGNYLTVFTNNKKILIRENMTDVFEIIPKEGFVRIHKSFVVALKHITTIESYQITIGKYTIPVGNAYKNDLKQILGIV